MHLSKMKAARHTYNGKTLTLPEWSEETGVPQSQLYSRVNKLGWSIERAIETPTIKGTPRNDLLGKRVGILTVIGPARRSPSDPHRWQWLCRCDCGTEVWRDSGYLNRADRLSKKPSSCGCLIRNEHYGTPLYYKWHGMIQRCYNEKAWGYAKYGGCGIDVCPEWKDSKNFMEWSLNNGYSDGLYLSRTDKTKDYSPENCTWTSPTGAVATRKTPSNTRFYNVDGENMSVPEMSRRVGIPPHTIHGRLRLGWTAAAAMKTPVHVHSSTYYELDGELYNTNQLADMAGISRTGMRYRLSRMGMTPEEAVSAPKRR